jgi:hypothetical protein
VEAEIHDTLTLPLVASGLLFTGGSALTRDKEIMLLIEGADKY